MAQLQSTSDDRWSRASYAHSVTSTMLSPSGALSRSGSRPATSLGRRSRATTASSILGHSDVQNIVCCISEARGITPAVGLAFVNVSVGEVILSQILDNQSYVRTLNKIQMIFPARIIFMATSCPPNQPSTLFSLVRQLVPEAQIDSFDRVAWSETLGLDYVRKLGFESDIDPLMVAIHGKFYAVASFSAVCIVPALWTEHLLTNQSRP